MSAPKPEQLVEFYDAVGSNHLRLRPGHTIESAAPLYQLSLDVADTPDGPEDYETDSGYLVDLSGLTEVRITGQVWDAASSGTTLHLHYSPDRERWGDLTGDVAVDAVAAVATAYQAIPEEARRLVALGFGIEGADGTTPVNASFVVQAR